MSEIIKFSRALKYIKTVDNVKVDLPNYLSRRISYYQFNYSDNTVEINCSECNSPYKVLKLENINNHWVWKDIHQEEEYHLMSEKSGFSACCIKCKLKQDKRKKEDISNKRKHENEIKKGYTVFLSDENKRYLQLRRIADGIEITNLLNSLISDEKRKHPLSIVETD